MFSRQHIVATIQVALFAGVMALAAMTTDGEDWRPLELLAMLAAFVLVSELLTVKGGSLRISGSFIAIVLAMVALGPLPAAVVGLAGIVLDAVRSRPAPHRLAGNLATYAAFPVAGSLAFEALAPAGPAADPYARVAAVLVLFMAANVLNFLMIAAPLAFCERRSLRRDFAEVLWPLLPSQLASAALTAGVDALHLRHGVFALSLAVVVVLVFQHLLRTTLLSVERAQQLEQRSRELASLQMGLITTVLRTLSLRDKMTARHSAAVARYAREVARELGLDREEQERIHTAGLLHDIGKFIFPDSILLSSRGLTDAEFAVVRRHPEQGARLVRRIQGYEDVAEIIHCHHERIDGRGYPRGLSGGDIPIGSRILAVCDTYDVMTSRDSYRSTVSPREALDELERVSGSQLDPVIVAVFCQMIERRGIAFRHGDDVDFEAELNLETRVAQYASPRAVEV